VNYQKIYEQLISKRRIFVLDDNQYGEKHHILPRCLGGSDRKENIVKLTAREHFIAHMLLVRIYPTGSAERNKMLTALKRMRCGNKEQRNVKNSARLYEYHRKEFSESMSKRLKGLRHTKEHCENISKSKTGKKRPDIETYKKTSTELWKKEDYRQKQQESRFGRKLSSAHKENIGAALKGRARTEETKQKIKEKKAANRAKNPDDYDKHIKCKYCDVKTNAANIKRHHDENCKSKAWVP
jgi:hypothetical protein